MHAVAVFPVDVMGYHHVRLVVPEYFDHVILVLVFSVPPVCFIQVKGKPVMESADQGIGPHSGCPEAVQQLRPAFKGAFRDVAHQYVHFTLPGVIGNHRA